MNTAKCYEASSDEELTVRFHQGDELAMNFILNKYKPLVRKKARPLYLMGGDNDDLIQEGMIGLYQAVRDFNHSKAASFYSFAELCISRQMYSAITASKRKKHIPLNSYVSLNGEYQENQEPLLLNTNPENLVLDKEYLTMVEYEIERSLSTFEKKVLTLYLSGISYTEISDQLGKSSKSVDNALQRIRAKLSAKISR